MHQLQGNILSATQAYDWLSNSSLKLVGEASFCSAYLKTSILEKLDKKISSHNQLKILVRWELIDLISGASDLSAYEFAKSRNWQFYMNLNSHVKVYHFPPSGILIGSANATNSGLGIINEPNIEAATVLKESPEDLKFIDQLFKNSYRVTDDFFGELKLAVQNAPKNKIDLDWPIDIYNKLMLTQANNLNFFMSELFKSDGNQIISNKKGKSIDSLSDLSLMTLKDEDNDIELIANRFKRTKVYLWLLNLLNEEGGSVYFGRVSHELHNALIEDPAPYRKKVKELQKNIYSWIRLLGPELSGIRIDQPNHSERLCLC